MINPSIFTACIPVLQRYLQSLRRIVAALESMPGGAAAELLLARLAPDMLPFHAQVETAVQFARRTAFPLAGKPVPAFVADETSFATLYRKIDQVIEELHALAPSNFAAADTRLIPEKAGAADISLPAEQFLHEYALPNFFFHLNMAYAIARTNGVSIGKGTYDGFHDYTDQNAALQSASSEQR